MQTTTAKPATPAQARYEAIKKQYRDAFEKLTGRRPKTSFSNGWVIVTDSTTSRFRIAEFEQFNENFKNIKNTEEMENSNTPKVLSFKTADVKAVIEAGVPDAKWQKTEGTLIFVGQTNDTNSGLKSNFQMTAIKNKWTNEVEKFVRQPLLEMGIALSVNVVLNDNVEDDEQKFFQIVLDLKPAANEKPTAAPIKPAKTAKTGVQTEKKTGVIQTILNCIIAGDATQSSILAKLVADFPEKEEAGMLKTITAQIGSKKQPTRMENEKNVKFVITEKDGVRTWNIAK